MLCSLGKAESRLHCLADLWLWSLLKDVRHGEGHIAPLHWSRVELAFGVGE